VPWQHGISRNYKDIQIAMINWWQMATSILSHGHGVQQVALTLRLRSNNQPANMQDRHMQGKNNSIHV